MEDFLKMDIFFVVTTAVVFVVGLFLVAALYYVVRILRSVDEVMVNVSAESNNLRDDIRILREKVREEGMKMKHVSDFFSSITSRNRKKGKKHDAI